MHTLPHQLITGRDGNVDSETVQILKSLSGTDLKIKRNLDGNTFLGYDGLDPEHWVCFLQQISTELPMLQMLLCLQALVIGDPLIAIDGVVSVVDWPLVCNSCQILILEHEVCLRDTSSFNISFMIDFFPSLMLSNVIPCLFSNI